MTLIYILIVTVPIVVILGFIINLNRSTYDNT